MSLKKIIISVLTLAIIVLLIVLAISNNNKLILQGEVDTKNIDLSSKISGRVIKIHVKEGDMVNVGDNLITLDIPELIAKRGQIDASIILAQKDLKRMKKLSEAGAMSIQKFDEAQANINKLIESKNEVQAYIDEKIIKSPIKGTVKEIVAEEGELIGTGYTVITIVDDTDNWVVFNLREDLISKIKIGSEFNVKIPALSSKPMKVKVYYISAMGNYATWRATKIRGDFDLKTFEVRAKPIEKQNGMIAGMSVLLDWNRVNKN